MLTDYQKDAVTTLATGNLDHTKTMNRIIEALKQESTWRGIIAIAAAGGIQIQPELSSAIITVALALIGSINVIKNK